MLVGFDYQIFSQEEFGGISRYYCALASQLSLLPEINARIVAPLHINKYLKEAASDLAVGRYIRRLPRTGRVIRALSSALFQPTMGKLRPDVIHETYYSEKPSYCGKTPRVLTVYDMIHERCPDSFARGDQLARLKGCAVRRADHIFCISENTRRDLLDIHHIPEDRVTVTYLASNALTLSGLTAAELVGSTPFILHVGGRHGYKNFLGLARAYAASTWLKNNFRIVCFGGGAMSSEERHVLAEIGLSEAQVIHLSGGDDRLAALYRGASVFVYPSMYEGFGIPPLEAMSLDCPVVCSGTSSIPEVVGEAGEYFNPGDVESITHAVERVLQSSGRRSELIALGRLRRELFSWQRCARETVAVYKGLAG